MTRESQKELEVIYAGIASKLLKEEWIIEPSPNEKDWPDLIIRVGDKSFGLEVRNVFKDEGLSGSKLKKNESHRMKLIQTLSQMYYGVSDIPISLKINGHLSSEILDEIIAEVLKEIPFLGDFGRKNIVINNRNTKLYIYRLPKIVGTYNCWQYVGDYVGWPSTLRVEDIEKPIRQKEEKITKYLKNLSNICLLLVLDRTKNSGRIEIPEKLAINSSKFDDIYLLSYPEKAVKLKCNEQ